MRKTVCTMAVAVMATAGYLTAGGFWLQLGNPEASAEARKARAVVTIKAVGCHDPATAKVTATAIGMVNGERRTDAAARSPSSANRGRTRSRSSGRRKGSG